jgi:hypothetical protein
MTEPPGPGVSDLTLADVLDLRAYERVREDYRARSSRANATGGSASGRS